MLTKLRRGYTRAGTLYKHQGLDWAVALLGYHRKVAICRLDTAFNPFQLGRDIERQNNPIEARRRWAD